MGGLQVDQVVEATDCKEAILKVSEQVEDGSAEVINDGEDGLLFPPGDYISMKLKIEKLIENPGLRTQLVKSAAENVHGNYTWQKITEGMIRAFNYTYG